jgi:hypothetical protein
MLHGSKERGKEVKEKKKEDLILVQYIGKKKGPAGTYIEFELPNTRNLEKKNEGRNNHYYLRRPACLSSSLLALPGIQRIIRIENSLPDK